MTSAAATLMLPTRPKIHRLPALPRAQKKSLPSIDFSKLYVGAAVVLVVVGMGVELLPRSGELPKIDELPTQVKMIPGIVIGGKPSAKLEKTASDTIVIKGERGGIVGQMARIPTPNVQVTEIQGVSNVDKTSGPELLSIVNKY